jgi:hypothetical protein
MKPTAILVPWNLRTQKQLDSSVSTPFEDKLIVREIFFLLENCLSSRARQIMVYELLQVVEDAKKELPNAAKPRISSL